MKIYKQIGSKERLFEMMERVNKINIKEFDTNESINLNTKNVLDVAYNELVSKKLDIKQSNTQNTNEDTYVELLCLDSEGNNITFTFKTSASEDEQDGVFNVNNVILTSFSFDDSSTGEQIDLDENDLRQFNQQHGNELFNVIEDYIDYEEPEPEIDEEYENAIKKIDSYPYGGGRDNMQTGKAYADEKPTNNSIRVNAPELNKFVDEEEVPMDKLPQDKASIIKAAYYNLTRKKGRPQYAPSTSEISTEIARMRQNKELDEINTVKRVEDIPYVGINNAIRGLSREQKDYIIKTALHNVNDKLASYGMSYKNYSRDEFAKLIKDEARRVYEEYLATGNEGSGLNENDEYPDPIGKKFKVKSKYPKSKKKPTTTVSIDEGDEYSSNNDENEPELEIGEPDLSSLEKETGDTLSGGLGDNKSAKEFDTEQILMGLKVEMEHTDDPMVAMEIAIDHLTEIPDYYTRLNSMEADAKNNMDMTNPDKDMGSPAEFKRKTDITKSDKSEKEMEDVLLGYEPKNVGDNVDEELTGYQKDLINKIPNNKVSTSIPKGLGKSGYQQKINQSNKDYRV